MRIAVKRGIDEFIAEARRGVTEPSPALLALLREASTLLGTDERHRATLLMNAGVLHDMGRDIDGANDCYAAAATLRPHVVREGPLAEVRRALVRKRPQKAGVVRTVAQPSSPASAPTTGPQGRRSRPRAGQGRPT